MNSEKLRNRSQSKGLHVIVVVTLFLHACIAGYAYRVHKEAVAASMSEFDARYSENLRLTNEVKEEIRILEAVATWEETQFALMYGTK
jgi:hypothetical protein